MKRHFTFLYITLLNTFIFSFCTISAFAFEPNEYTYTTQSIFVGGEEMVELRIYDAGQSLEFSEEDFRTNEGFEEDIDRSFNDQDFANMKGAMVYVKDVFRTPDSEEVPINAGLRLNF